MSSDENNDGAERRQAFDAARSMIEASLDSLVAISPEGKITDANEATVKLTGVPRGKLIGTSFADYFTEPEKAQAIYRRVLAEGSAADYPLTLLYRDGHETQTEVLYNASVYRDAGGNVLGVFAAARDMTDQKKAAEYARSLIEATLDSLVVISPEGRITDTNAAMVILTGMPRDRLIGTSFSEHFTDPEKAREVHERAFEDGAVTDLLLMMRHHDGHETKTEVLCNASVYRDSSGNALGVIAAARDVTMQMQAQRAMAEKQAAEQERLAELERFQRLTVGRELKMIELKKEIESLKRAAPGVRPEPDHER